ncbi:pinopsin-like protein [Lates japonicus]|uniref:Pinopsin-like protein n=1 Tax=Lates japonicus TaxID=270547 RepID=A0AAD3R485_LATJO|nr:pinopsin-like protein [Lates japonicus]
MCERKTTSARRRRQDTPLIRQENCVSDPAPSTALLLPNSILGPPREPVSSPLSNQISTSRSPATNSPKPKLILVAHYRNKSKKQQQGLERLEKRRRQKAGAQSQLDTNPLNRKSRCLAVIPSIMLREHRGCIKAHLPLPKVLQRAWGRI